MRRTIYLILLTLTSLHVKAQSSLIQLSGIVAEERSGLPLSFATVRVIGSYRGTIASANGFFSIVVAPNDSLLFSTVGYSSRLFVVPDTLNDMIASVGVFLSIDTMMLDVVEVYPWPSREDFRDAFLALQMAETEFKMRPIPGIKTVVDTVPQAPTIFNPITLIYEEIFKPIEWKRVKRDKPAELPEWEMP